MYKIIGTDQQEYGPVSAQQILQWISQGRLNAQSKAQLDGGEWKQLRDFPEFATVFAPSAASPSPAISPAAIPPAPPNAKTSGLAIASLILGILGIFTCGLSAIVGLILGIMAMSRVKKSNGALTGQGLALAGTIVSGVFLLMLPLDAAMLLPALAKAKSRAESIQCMNNMRYLDQAVLEYAREHQGQYPPAATWCDAIHSHVGSTNMFKCPSANQNDRCDYAFNSRLSGMDQKDIPRDTVVLFETDDQWNANGGPELLPRTWRHNHACIVAFADGHVEVVLAGRISQLRWNP